MNIEVQDAMRIPENPTCRAGMTRRSRPEVIYHRVLWPGAPCRGSPAAGMINGGVRGGSGHLYFQNKQGQGGIQY